MNSIPSDLASFQAFLSTKYPLSFKVSRHLQLINLKKLNENVRTQSEDSNKETVNNNVESTCKQTTINSNNVRQRNNFNVPDTLVMPEDIESFAESYGINQSQDLVDFSQIKDNTTNDFIIKDEASQQFLPLSRNQMDERNAQMNNVTATTYNDDTQDDAVIIPDSDEEETQDIDDEKLCNISYLSKTPLKRVQNSNLSDDAVLSPIITSTTRNSTANLSLNFSQTSVDSQTRTCVKNGLDLIGCSESVGEGLIILNEDDTNALLDGYEIMFIGQFDLYQYSKERLMELCIEYGGKVINEKITRPFLILCGILKDKSSITKMKELAKCTSMRPLKVTWLIDSINQKQLLPRENYDMRCFSKN
ncbi:unnamed protein product [Didymodactylos carnosus]|uniref:BRCT domain-containing protein n=1 Tax=Didymodactylos carnosus TaxID=1234261 RepID=A0A813Z7I4_9BILA|nr:unnamed protein product [Didymodactylos carnosus]CAF0894951.1 unnamed protein product [Didymodactylos carnosus]CAF3668886.1 unnamed protein product [Didymodactylos carnosus]CAF3678552.1 unnamed protein product [Didymodactylos carnosus]